MSFCGVDFGKYDEFQFFNTNLLGVLFSIYFLATALAVAPEIFMACVACQYKYTEGHGCNKEFFGVGFWNYSGS